MPIVWGVDHGVRMVVATARGALRKKDFDDYLDGLSAGAIFPLRKIFDMGQASLDLSEDDMMAIGARIRDHVSAGPAGPVAVVASAEHVYSQAKLLASFVATARPLEVFRETEAAREWLDTVDRAFPAREGRTRTMHTST